MPTLLEIMVAAGQLAGKVSAGTVGTGSTQHVLVDPSLRDSGVDPGHHAGAWVYIPSLAAAEAQRQTTREPFRRDVGGLEVTRPWTVAPLAAAAYYLFSPWPAMPHPDYPNSWRDAVNRALRLMDFEDRVTLTVVGGQTRRFTLAAISGWNAYPAAVSRVFVRTAGDEYSDQDMSRNGYSARKYMDQGTLTVELPGAPLTGSTVMADVIRPYAELMLYSDATTGPLDLETASWGAYWQYLVLSRAPENEVAEAWRRWWNRYLDIRPPVRVTV